MAAFNPSAFLSQYQLGTPAFAAAYSALSPAQQAAVGAQNTQNQQAAFNANLNPGTQGHLGPGGVYLAPTNQGGASGDTDQSTFTSFSPAAFLQQYPPGSANYAAALAALSPQAAAAITALSPQQAAALGKQGDPGGSTGIGGQQGNGQFNAQYAINGSTVKSAQTSVMAARGGLYGPGGSLSTGINAAPGVNPTTPADISALDTLNNKEQSGSAQGLKELGTNYNNEFNGQQNGIGAPGSFNDQLAAYRNGTGAPNYNLQTGQLESGISGQTGLPVPGVGGGSASAPFDSSFVAPPTNLWAGIAPGGPPPPAPAQTGLGSVAAPPPMAPSPQPTATATIGNAMNAQQTGLGSLVQVQTPPTVGLSPVTIPNVQSGIIQKTAIQPQGLAPMAPASDINAKTGIAPQGQAPGAIPPPNAAISSGGVNGLGSTVPQGQAPVAPETTAPTSGGIGGTVTGITGATVPQQPALYFGGNPSAPGQFQAGYQNAGYQAQQALNNQAGQALGATNASTGLLAQAAAGTTPSAADISMQQGISASTRAQLAAAASARGGAYGQEAAAQQAGTNAAGVQSQGVGQAAALRAQEIATAQQAYSGAQLSQQGINNQMALGSEGLGVQANQNYQQLGFNVLGQQLNAQATAEGYATQAALAQAQMNQAGTNAAIGGVTGLAEAAAMYSDITGKQDIQPQGAGQIPQVAPQGMSRQDVLAMLAQMRGSGAPPQGAISSDERGKEGSDGAPVADSYLEALARSKATYSYKDPSQQPTSSPRPPGARYGGVMAQSLEQVPEIGAQLVTNTPRGKTLEGGANLSAALMGLGRLAERVKALEGMR